jgi:hypothetical protein
METTLGGEIKESADVSKDIPVSEAPQKEDSDLSFREALEKNLKSDEKPALETEKKELVNKPEVKQVEKAEKKDIIPPIAAPADMSQEEKDMFTKADPKLQSYLSRRAYENRAALSREMQKIQEKARIYEGLEKAIEPHRDYLYKLGVTPETALNRAVAWDRAVSQDRIGGAREWLAAHGIDPYELIDESGQPQQQQAQPIDPERIKQEVFEEINQKFMREQESRATENNFNAVERFKSSKILFKDPNTALQLEADLAPVIESLVRKNPKAAPEDVLETAYNYVTKGDEKYSTLLNAYNQREKAEQAKVESEKARSASKTITGGLAGSSPAKQGLSFRDELRLRVQGGM